MSAEAPVDIREADIELFAQVEKIADLYSTKRFGELLTEIDHIMDGKLKANRDHKRILCHEINSLIDYLIADRSDSVQRYRLDNEGNIEIFYPNEETTPLLDAGQYGALGSIG